MQITTYLFFKDTCEDAFNFYAQALGGKITMMSRFGDAPPSPQLPASMKDAIMHVRLEVDGQALMGSDTPPAYWREGGNNGFSVSVNVASIAQAERVFAALAEGGEISMPLDKTFWAVRFGQLTDRFGVSWMVNCEKDG